MARSNTKILTRKAGLIPDFTPVVTYDDGKRSIPRVLRLRVRALKQGYTDEDQAQLAQLCGGAGVWWNKNNDTGAAEPWVGGGALRIRYGTEGGIYRDIIADLREGEYNIPPCSYITVSAAYWDPLDAEAGGIFYSSYYTAQQLDGIDLEVSADVVDGDSLESTPLVVTASRIIPFGPPSFGEATCVAPPGAYAFDVGGGTVRVYGNSAEKYFERDPESGKWLPPSTPILLSTGRLFVGTTQKELVGDGTNLETWQPTITFFVR